MAPKRSTLLVEGRSDEELFKQFCKQLSLDATVRIATPRSAIGGATGANKESVFNNISFFAKQFEDGSLDGLGVVIDADTAMPGGGGMGYQSTVDRFTTIVGPFSFDPDPRLSSTTGASIYTSSKFRRRIGLWVMPDNSSDGILEDAVKNWIDPSEVSLYQQAAQTVSRLTLPKFKPLHRSKAEVATWLAWQKRPGMGLESTLDDGLLNFAGTPLKRLETWLRAVFP